MIILDMDGVLVNFCKGAYQVHEKEWDESLPTMWDFYHEWGLNDDQFWGPINDRGPSWWANLPLYSWATELIDLCRTYDDEIVVATASNHHGYSAAGKVAALQALFGDKFRDYFITPRKWLLGGPGRILIDDLDANCDKFVEYGGKAILFPQPWNNAPSKLGTGEEKVNYVSGMLSLMQNIDEVVRVA